MTTPVTTDPDLLTIEEAAERRIVFYRLGRSVRIDPADLAAHIHSGRVEPITRETVWRDLRSVA